MGLLGHLKNHIVRPGSRPRKIRSGALKGQWMNLDLRHDAQVYLGLYERELHRTLRRFGGSAITAIDAGAADGGYSLFFLKQPHVQSVFAFEPDQTMRELLQVNLGLNGFSHDTRMRVFDAPVGNGHASNGVPLDDLYSRVEPPFFVKVDVEGHEVAVLRGAQRLLARGASSWLIETHSLELEVECIRLLQSYGLAVEIVSPAWWRFAVPELRPIGHNRWLVAQDKGPHPR